MADENFNREVRVTKLSKATYSRWKIEIRDALESHRIWEIAGGITVKPEEARNDDGTVSNSREIEDWKVKDSKARSIIRSTPDDTMFDRVCDCESSADIMKRIKTVYEPKTLNVLLELLREFFIYSWKPDSTVGTFVAGLKVIARRIEALESEDFGRSFNEKLLMAKILGCLPKDFDNFVTSWSLLSEDVSLESFLEKLTNAERSIAERLDDTTHEVFKAKSKLTNNQTKKTINKTYQGKCHKCGKKEHMQRDCWSKSIKSEKPEASEEKKVSKDHKNESGLSASSVLKANVNNCIIADSGASVHLTRILEWFSSLRKLTSPIVLSIANGKTLWATHVGNIEIEKSVNGKQWEERTWENVYYSKDMSSESLFSTTFMEMTKGYGFYHGNGIMRLVNGRKTILGGKGLEINMFLSFESNHHRSL
ncbi:copia protein [Lasius niger]|uniref:Copia protein n=1 Tax=Lasius niger TaxID=67767 RepID=A0A0J7K9B0_LASNI|nr:copia protein [Lasius niger]